MERALKRKNLEGNNINVNKKVLIDAKFNEMIFDNDDINFVKQAKLTDNLFELFKIKSKNYGDDIYYVIDVQQEPLIALVDKFYKNFKQVREKRFTIMINGLGGGCYPIMNVVYIVDKLTSNTSIKLNCDDDCINSYNYNFLKCYASFLEFVTMIIEHINMSSVNNISQMEIEH